MRLAAVYFISLLASPSKKINSEFIEICRFCNCLLGEDQIYNRPAFLDRKEKEIWICLNISQCGLLFLVCQTTRSRLFKSIYHNCIYAAGRRNTATFKRLTEDRFLHWKQAFKYFTVKDFRLFYQKLNCRWTSLLTLYLYLYLCQPICQPL